MTLTGPLELVDDAELSRRLAMPVRRPSSPLIPGRIYEPTECYTTSCTLVIGSGPDLTPSVARRRGRASARCSSVTPRVPAGSRAPMSTAWRSWSTGPTTPRRPSPSRSAHTSARRPRRSPRGRDRCDVRLRRRSPIGAAAVDDLSREAVGRMRDGEPFRAAGPFCFSVVMIDWAGNIGARSEVQCLDTTDPDDPTVEFVASSGCGCNAPADPGGAAPLVLAILVVSARSARRRRGSPRSPRTR